MHNPTSKARHPGASMARSDAMQQPKQMPDSSPAPIRVLIVDDHPIVASGCRALLAGEGRIEILEASDAESGERVFVAEAPDICVLDVNLPTVSGFVLARRILGR